MRVVSSWLGLWGVVLLPMLLCPDSLGAQEDDHKAPLSEKVRQVIDADGVEAAERWYTSEYPARKSEYEVDYEGFTEVAQEYMQAGDYESGALVMRIMSEGALEGIPAAATMSAPAKPSPESSAPAPATPFVNPESRNDLEMFYGLYAEPGQDDPVRGLIVTEMCGGYLYVATTWGDATPWLMNPVSDTEFEYADSWIHFSMEFQSTGDGSSAIVHDLDYLPSPLPRIGPRPDGWQECIKDMRG